MVTSDPIPDHFFCKFGYLLCKLDKMVHSHIHIWRVKEWSVLQQDWVECASCNGTMDRERLEENIKAYQKTDQIRFYDTEQELFERYLDRVVER